MGKSNPVNNALVVARSFSDVAIHRNLGVFMAEQPKIAGFALVDDFNGEVLKRLGNCLYKNNVIPIVISLKKGRNVVDRDKTLMTETDLTFARARTQIDALVLADDYSIEQLMNHGPFRKLVQKMVEENQLIIAMGKAPVMLVETGVALGRKVCASSEVENKLEKAKAQVENKDVVIDRNLITAKSIEQTNSVCSLFIQNLKKAA
jgi:protease I